MDQLRATVAGILLQGAIHDIFLTRKAQYRG